jgi:hypothetical protein
MNRFTSLGFDSHEAMMLQDAYDAVTKADMWDYLKKPTTPGKDGFMFSPAIELAAINAEMVFDGHSGASYAWTMRQMETIAKTGWDSYAKSITSKRAMEALRVEEATLKRQADRTGRPCGCRAAQGYTTGWCGVAGGGVPACDH